MTDDIFFGELGYILPEHGEDFKGSACTCGLVTN